MAGHDDTDPGGAWVDIEFIEIVNDEDGAASLFERRLQHGSAVQIQRASPRPRFHPGDRRHHDPAWAGCKKQADDKKLEPGDARKEFMRNCVKAAHASTPAAS